MSSMKHYQVEVGRGFLAHHFSSLKQQYESAKVGMWLFLITEVLLFGGLFCAYSVYRANRPEIFVYGHRYLDVNLGALNTIILICSSFTVALAVRCAQLGQRRLLVIFLAMTILGGLGFLGIKYVEYEQKWKHGLLWGKYFRAERSHERVEEIKGATASGLFLDRAGDVGIASAGRAGSGLESSSKEESFPQPKNLQTFFAIYFAMTGLHGLHVLAGIFALMVMLTLALKGRFGPLNFTAIDLTALYWHLVDLIWIYLFPLFYLIH